MEVKVVYATPFSDITNLENETVCLFGCTLADLVTSIAVAHGATFKNTFLDASSGEIIPGMVALVNGRRARPTTTLSEGDEITFLMAISGGG